MCEHCVIRGRRAWAELSLPSDTKNIIEQAIRASANDETYERGVSAGEDQEEKYRSEAYKKKVVPVREALIAAVNEAARDTHLDATAVLNRLIENVRRDADRIPLRLPSA